MNVFITGAAGFIGGSIANTAIARRLDLGPVKSWTVEEATSEWGEGHARYSFGSNSRVRARRARRELSWAPMHDSLTEWIEHEMPVA